VTLAPDSPSTRRRAPEERPQQIIDAAFHEFGERGLAGTRLDDIAKRAQVAKGTIYLYFPNKEALFREMVRTTIVVALSEAEASQEAHKDASSASQIREFATRSWNFHRTDRVRVLKRLVHDELVNFPDLMAFYADEVIARGRRLMASIVERGITRGEFRPVDPHMAARMYSALLISHSTWCNNRAFHPQLGTDDQVLDEILGFYLHALKP